MLLAGCHRGEDVGKPVIEAAETRGYLVPWRSVEISGLGPNAEAQLATRTDDPEQLRERAVLVGHRAEHERRDASVDRCVLGGQPARHAVDHLEREPVEQLAVQSGRAAHALEAAVLEPAHVIDEVGRVALGREGHVPAGADLFERRAGDVAITVVLLFQGCAEPGAPERRE